MVFAEALDVHSASAQITRFLYVFSLKTYLNITGQFKNAFVKIIIIKKDNSVKIIWNADSNGPIDKLHCNLSTPFWTAS